MKERPGASGLSRAVACSWASGTAAVHNCGSTGSASTRRIARGRQCHRGRGSRAPSHDGRGTGSIQSAVWIDFSSDANGQCVQHRGPRAGQARGIFDGSSRCSRGCAAQCDRLLNLNQDAMRRKAAEAATLARRWFMTTLGLALTFVLGGSWYALFLSNRIVRPVRQVTEATSRIAAGDLEPPWTSARPTRSACWRPVSTTMAVRIRELRQSDLGKMLVAQQTADGGDGFPLRSGHRDRRRRTRAAGQPRRRSALRARQRRSLGKPVQDVTNDPRLSMAVAGRARIAAAGRQRGERGHRAAARRRRRAVVPAADDADARRRRARWSAPSCCSRTSPTCGSSTASSRSSSPARRTSCGRR